MVPGACLQVRPLTFPAWGPFLRAGLGLGHRALPALRRGGDGCVSRTQFISGERLSSWDSGQILDFCSTLVIMTPTGHLDKGQKSSPAGEAPSRRWLVVCSRTRGLAVVFGTQSGRAG